MMPASYAQTVTLMEVSPRDGLQNESATLSTEEKLQLFSTRWTRGSNASKSPASPIRPECRRWRTLKPSAAGCRSGATCIMPAWC